MHNLPDLDPKAEALWKLIAQFIDQGKCPSIQELIVGMDAGVNSIYFWLGMLVGRGLVQRREGHREVSLLVHPNGDNRTASRKTAYTILRRGEWQRRIGALSDSSHEVWRYLEDHPITTRAAIAAGLGVSTTTAIRHLETLALLGIVTLAENEARGVHLAIRHDEIEAATLAFPTNS